MEAEVILLKEELPIELNNGNDGRGGRWFNSAAVRKKIESILRALGLVREPFDEVVRLRLTRLVGPGQRKWDSDSGLRGNAKELIDALVACGWFHDDGPKYISETQFRQDASQRQRGPAVVIEVLSDEN